MSQDLIGITTDYSEIKPSLLQLKLQKSTINTIKQKINSLREDIKKEPTEENLLTKRKNKNNLTLILREGSPSKKIKIENISYSSTFALDDSKYAPFLKPYENSNVNITLISSIKNQELKPIKSTLLQNYIKTLKEKQIQTQLLVHQFYYESIMKNRFSYHQAMNDKRVAFSPSQLSTPPTTELVKEITQSHNATLTSSATTFPTTKNSSQSLGLKVNESPMKGQGQNQPIII